MSEKNDNMDSSFGSGGLGDFRGSYQNDYFKKELEQAQNLFKLQEGNATKLKEHQLSLLKQVLTETLKEYSKTNDEIAADHQEKMLKAIKTEIQELRSQATKLHDELITSQQAAFRNIRQAEKSLSEFRLQTVQTETAKRLESIARVNKAELEAIKRRLEAEPGSDSDERIKALESLEGQLSSLIDTLGKDVDTATKARAEQLAQLENMMTAETAAVRKANEEQAESFKDRADALATPPSTQPQTPAPETPAALEAQDEPLGGLEETDTVATRVKSAMEIAAENFRAAVSVTAKEAFDKAEKETAKNLAVMDQAEQDLFKLKLNNMSLLQLEALKNSNELAAKTQINAAKQALIDDQIAKRNATLKAKALADLQERQDSYRQQVAMDEAKDLRTKYAFMAALNEDHAKKQAKKRKKQGLDANPESFKLTPEQITEAFTKGKAGLQQDIENIKATRDRSLTDSDAQYKADLAAIDSKVATAQAEAEANGEIGFDPEAFRKGLEEAAEADKQARLKTIQQVAEEELTAKTNALDLYMEAEKAQKKSQDKDAKKKQEDRDNGRYGIVGKAVGNVTAFANAQAHSQELKAKYIADGMDPEEAAKKAEEDVQDSLQKRVDAVGKALGNFVDQLNAKGKTTAMKQGLIDTRLQGSKDNKKSIFGSYWGRIDTNIGSNVFLSMVMKQETVAASFEKLVQTGIAFNLQQRAALDAYSEKIANTFNSTDATLLKLVRIQQADSTAARLGMESALTEFLNSMYETTEFMTQAAEGIRQSLYEATALMGAEQATEYEYQVQKWLGSLYSVGFNASDKIADALGKLTAGDITGITEGGIGNLLIMAANEASLPIAEILEKGLTPDQTNKLMASMVEYLARIYEETGNSNVLAQQYANVFGVTAADLKAASNLMTTGFESVKSTQENYDSLLQQVADMQATMLMRTSGAEMMENLKENASYMLATSLASNPVTSSLNYMANMLNDLTGGIKIPFINIYGFGFNLEASIADLMNVAALSGAAIGTMGKVIGALGNLGSSGALENFGVNLGPGGATKFNKSNRYDMNSLNKGGAETSSSGYVGNESGDDVVNKTTKDNSEDPEKQIAEAKEEQEDKEEARTQLIDGHILQIYELLVSVTEGSKKWHVQLDVGNTASSWSLGTWN